MGAETSVVRLDLSVALVGRFSVALVGRTSSPRLDRTTLPWSVGLRRLGCRVVDSVALVGRTSSPRQVGLRRRVVGLRRLGLVGLRHLGWADSFVWVGRIMWSESSNLGKRLDMADSVA